VPAGFKVCHSDDPLCRNGDAEGCTAVGGVEGNGAIFMAGTLALASP